MEKKNIFVTGAANGIGKAVAYKYSEEGYTVVAADIAFKEKNIIKSDQYSNFYNVGLDVGNEEEVNEVVDKVEKEIGNIGILVHVAGVFKLASVEETTLDEWERIFRVNTTGVYHVTKAITEKMKKRNQGTIIVVSSNASKYPRMGMAAYAASKAATSMFVKCLGLEMAQYNIRCNIVSPGSTDTDMQRQIWNGSTTIPSSILEGDLNNYRLGIPLHKIAKPSEIAEAVFFLASEHASHITMEELTVDGGATMGV